MVPLTGRTVTEDSGILQVAPSLVKRTHPNHMVPNTPPGLEVIPIVTFIWAGRHAGITAADADKLAVSGRTAPIANANTAHTKGILTNFVRCIINLPA
jgi:hypothetical protein